MRSDQHHCTFKKKQIQPRPIKEDGGTKFKPHNVSLKNSIIQKKGKYLKVLLGNAQSLKS